MLQTPGTAQKGVFSAEMAQVLSRHQYILTSLATTMLNSHKTPSSIRSLYEPEQWPDLMPFCPLPFIFNAVSIATTEQEGRDTRHIADLGKALRHHVITKRNQPKTKHNNNNESLLAFIFCQLLATVTQQPPAPSLPGSLCTQTQKPTQEVSCFLRILTKCERGILIFPQMTRLPYTFCPQGDDYIRKTKQHGFCWWLYSRQKSVQWNPQRF